MRVFKSLPPADITVTNTFSLPLVLPKWKKTAGKIHVHVARMPKGQMKRYYKAGAHRLLAVSPPVADAILKEAPMAQHVTRTIPYFIRTDIFCPGDCSNERLDSGVVLYGGRIHPEKGLHLLVDALRILHEAGAMKIISVRAIGPWETEGGGGGAAYRDELLARAKGLPFQIDGPIYNREAFAEALRSASVFCYPSVAEEGETFGVAPLEAMACGTPVILSGLSVFKTFFEPGVHGAAFDHTAPDASTRLADAIVAHFAKPTEELVATSAACAERGHDFGISRIADQYLEDFVELTGLES